MAENGRTIKPGDVVRLPSGGPLMTVGEVVDDGAAVAWFDGATLRAEEDVPLAILRPVDPPVVRPAGFSEEWRTEVVFSAGDRDYAGRLAPLAGVAMSAENTRTGECAACGESEHDCVCDAGQIRRREKAPKLRPDDLYRVANVALRAFGFELGRRPGVRLQATVSPVSDDFYVSLTVPKALYRDLPQLDGNLRIAGATTLDELFDLAAKQADGEPRFVLGELGSRERHGWHVARFGQTLAVRPCAAEETDGREKLLAEVARGDQHGTRSLSKTTCPACGAPLREDGTCTADPTRTLPPLVDNRRSTYARGRYDAIEDAADWIELTVYPGKRGVSLAKRLRDRERALGQAAHPEPPGADNMDPPKIDLRPAGRWFVEVAVSADGALRRELWERATPKLARL